MRPPDIAPVTPPPAVPEKEPLPAQTLTPAETQAPNYASRVVGHTAPPSRGTPDFNVEIGPLSAVPRKSAGDILKLAPGFHIENEGSEAHADQIFLRGFDAREGQDIEFSVGGVPINESGNLHGNGYADLHFIIPELVSALRVVEGPFDPRQGNYAVAGSAEFELGLAERGLTAKLTAGSFGTLRGLFLWGPAGGSEGTFVGAEIYRTDGFGMNRDGQRGTLMAQYAGQAGDTRYHLSAQAYLASFHSAGVVRQDDVQAGRVDFFGTYDTRQGADTSRYAISADMHSRHGDLVVHNQVFGIVRPFRLRENFTGFLLDPQQPIQSPHAQRGDLLDLESMAFTLGARGFARYATRLFGQLQALELGYFARADFISGSQRRIEAATGHPYHVDSDLESRLGDLGLYADLDLHPLKWLTVRGGARADLFTYDVLNKCAVQSVAHPSRTNPPGDASCLSQQDFGAYRDPTQRSTTASTALLPRASLIVGPFRGLTASLSYGQGVRSIDPSYIAQDAKTPFAAATGYEGGLAYTHSFAALDLAARSAVFATTVDRDLIFSETAGRNILGGPSTRLGVLGAVRATGQFFDLSANLTWVRATFNDTGLLIPYVPGLVLRADGTLYGDIPIKKLRLGGKLFHGSLSAGVNYISPRPLPQGESSNPIATLDLGVRLAWSLVEVGIIATNLFDTRYRLGEYNYVSNFQSAGNPTLVPERHFSAGAPREIFFTLTLNIGGGK